MVVGGVIIGGGAIIVVGETVIVGDKTVAVGINGAGGATTGSITCADNGIAAADTAPIAAAAAGAANTEITLDAPLLGTVLLPLLSVEDTDVAGDDINARSDADAKCCSSSSKPTDLNALVDLDVNSSNGATIP
jgi:hypothetical protein